MNFCLMQGSPTKIEPQNANGLLYPLPRAVSDVNKIDNQIVVNSFRPICPFKI